MAPDYVIDACHLLLVELNIEDDTRRFSTATATNNESGYVVRQDSNSGSYRVLQGVASRFNGADDRVSSSGGSSLSLERRGVQISQESLRNNQQQRQSSQEMIGSSSEQQQQQSEDGLEERMQKLDLAIQSSPMMAQRNQQQQQQFKKNQQTKTQQHHMFQKQQQLVHVSAAVGGEEGKTCHVRMKAQI